MSYGYDDLAEMLVKHHVGWQLPTNALRGKGWGLKPAEQECEARLRMGASQLLLPDMNLVSACALLARGVIVLGIEQLRACEHKLAMYNLCAALGDERAQFEWSDSYSQPHGVLMLRVCEPPRRAVFRMRFTTHHCSFARFACDETPVNEPWVEPC